MDGLPTFPWNPTLSPSHKGPKQLFVQMDAEEKAEELTPSQNEQLSEIIPKDAQFVLIVAARENDNITLQKDYLLYLADHTLFVSLSYKIASLVRESMRNK